ncbi:hypothetical protein FQR65_LT03536 [Abscondita terminalis]|nr:hypothetical protein FQR65_LT03536 [Abscondita terminalis]
MKQIYVFLYCTLAVGAVIVPQYQHDYKNFHKLVHYVQLQYESRYNIIAIVGNFNGRLRDVADWLLCDYRTMPTIVVNTFSNEQRKSTAKSNLIICLLENASEIETIRTRLTNYTFFSYDSYIFFVICDEITDVSWTMGVGESLWNTKILNFFFVYYTNKLEVVTYNPFVDQKLENYNDRYHEMFKNKNLNMNQYRLKGGAIEDIPRSIVRENKIYSNDYEFLLRILKQLNASVDVVTFFHGDVSYSMLNGQILSGDLDFGLMTYFLFNSSYGGVIKGAQYAYPYTMDAAVILVPNPKPIPTYLNIFLVFKYTTWIAFTTAFLAMMLAMEAVDCISRNMEMLTAEAPFFQIVRIISNVPTAENRKRMFCKRFIFGCGLWLAFFFHVSFGSNLTLTLVKPKQFEKINTLNELAETKMKIYITKIVAEYSSNYNAMSDQYVFATKGVIANMIISGQIQYAYGCSSLEASRIFIKEVQQKFGKNLFYKLKEQLVPGHRSYVFPINSPYITTIDKKKLQFYEFGLYENKLKSIQTRRFFINRTLSESDRTPLTLSHMQTPFYLLILGNVIAIIGNFNERLRYVADWVLCCKCMTLPVMVVDIFKCGRSMVTSNVIIFLMSNASEVERTQCKFSYDAHLFFVIFDEVADFYWITGASKRLWNKKIQNFFFVYLATNLEVVTYNPFDQKLEKYSEDRQYPKMFNNKQLNMNRYLVKGGVVEDIPRSIVLDDKIYSSDYDFMRRILDHLNASLEVVPYLYGDQSYSVLIKHIISGDVDFGMMSYFLFNTIYRPDGKYAEFAYPYKMDAAVILMPKPEPIPTYLNLFLVFKYGAWIAFIAGFLAITLLTEAVDEVSIRMEMVTGEASFLQIVRVISNVPTIERRRRIFTKRFVFGCCLWLAFFFNVSFNSNLILTLIKPKEFEKISTLSELVDTKRKIYITQTFAEYASNHNTMREQFVFANKNVIAEMVLSARILMAAVQKSFGANLFYILKEHLVPGHRAYAFPKNSPHITTINKIKLYFFEFGLRENHQKSTRKNVHVMNNTQDQSSETPLALSHVQTPFYLLILGLLIGTLVFWGEIFYSYKTRLPYLP